MTETHPPAPPGRAVVTDLRLVPPQGRLVLSGELDLHTADQLHAALAAVAVAPVSSLVVDMGAVEFASLAALGDLVAAARSLARRGGTMEIRGVRPLQRRVLDLLTPPESLVIPGDMAG